MKIAEFKPVGDSGPIYKAFQDGASSFGLSCTYEGTIQYKLEYASFDSLNKKWEKIKASFREEVRS